MKNEATVIYYSSNREDEQFERRIQEMLVKNSGGLPIVSVTHKPMTLGKNIVVGDVGVSGYNMFRQVLIACEATNTPFVISAEADTVYPPDYFTFRPKLMDVCYRDSNLYVMGDHRSYWFKKPEGATHAQIIGREYYIDVLKALFGDGPEWSPKEKNFPKERHKKEDVFDRIEYWETENPVFQIKTHRSMRYYTHSERIPVYTLPFWGDGASIRNYYLNGVKEIYAKV